jgi:hypothetical protein
MLKGILFSLITVAASFSMAAPSPTDVVFKINQAQILDQAHAQGLNWKVGETANYSIDMGFIKGTMVMSVREIAADGIWLDQNVDLGIAGKQVMSALVDPNTGEIKKMLVNGKEQAVPKNNTEVVEVKEDHITVPAGTFDCIHARIKDKDTNQETNAWINPQLIPISGMLKTVQPSQMGEVTMLLTSFKKM